MTKRPSSRPHLYAAAWLPLALLLVMYGTALAADLVAPYRPAFQDRQLPYAPPTRLRCIDANGKFHLRPFVYRQVPVAGAFGAYEDDTRRMFPIRLLPSRSLPDPGTDAIHPWALFGVESPAGIHLLGTDGLGRDLFSRLLHGARFSLFAGLLAALLTVGAGVVLGGLAGYFGGWVETSIMRGSELFMALPWLYLLVAVRAFLPLSLTPLQTLAVLVSVIGLLGWPRTARLVSGVVSSARERDYVYAARGFGASELYLLRRHVLPRAFAVAATQLTLLIPQYILAEVTLSFLGIGLGEPAPSWGNLLATLQQYHVLVSYWWMLSPAVALVAVVLGYYGLASAVQEHRRDLAF